MDPCTLTPSSTGAGGAGYFKRVLLIVTVRLNHQPTKTIFWKGIWGKLNKTFPSLWISGGIRAFWFEAKNINLLMEYQGHFLLQTYIYV